MSRSWEGCRGAMSAVVAVLFLGSAGAAWAQPACTPAQGTVLSFEGTLELRRAGGDWAAARPEQALCGGDMLRTGANSRAALRLASQSVVRLDQQSTLTLPAAAPGSTLELLRGVLNVMTRTPRPFTIRTPYLNAGVDGTEFAVRVDESSTVVSVLEGKVRASNELGSFDATSGDAVSAQRGQAPAGRRIARAVEAVQWALFYPGVVAPGATGATGAAGDLAQAERLLSVGRVDEARGAIAEVLARSPGASGALALLAIVAVVQNDAEAALGHAEGAVRAAPRAVAGHLALSYARQARFDIPGARAAAQAAADVAPDSARAWARLAELQLALNDRAASLLAAQRAAGLDPALSRIQTVLGFVHLARLEATAAQAAFRRAAELDSADHLPRLGLGLALDQAGEAGRGRESLELAAGLDPMNSLVRSYLGKAYAGEGRSEQAAVQYALAKQLDASDPTPWFYEAVRRQDGHRPVEALHELERAIALNDSRAVYRSRLLIDEDRAARGISLAQVYRDAGFSELASVEAARSLALAPANHSAHRFMADALSDLPRHEVARASELLQSQLLQPLYTAQLPPALPFIAVARYAGLGFSEPSLNDYSLLYRQRSSRGSISVLFGDQGTRGAEVLATLVRDRVVLSVGQFYQTTDGFRPNADLTHHIGSAFVQWALTDELSLQAEVRQRRTRYGDLTLNFAADDYLTDSRIRIDQDVARVGLSYAPSPRARWLASFMSNRRQEAQHHAAGPVTVDATGSAPGRQGELQFQYALERGNLTLGLGSSRVDLDTRLSVVFPGPPGGPCSADAPCGSSNRMPVRQHSAYAYANLHPRSDLTTTLGLGLDAYQDGTLDFRQWSPKLGLHWRPTDTLGLRAAAFKTLKRALIVDQTIEPTQVAGFNQLYDDYNGARTRTLAAALDLKPTPGLRGLLEVRQRRLRLGPNLVGVESELAIGPFEEWRERSAVAGLFWTPLPRLALTLQYREDDFERTPLITDQRPLAIDSRSVPLSVRYFIAERWSTQATLTHHEQRVVRAPSATKASGDEQFLVLDAAVAYRLPSVDGSISLTVNNVLDKRFVYQSDDFRVSQIRFPRYIPRRGVSVAASLGF